MIYVDDGVDCDNDGYGGGRDGGGSWWGGVSKELSVICEQIYSCNI